MSLSDIGYGIFNTSLTPTGDAGVAFKASFAAIVAQFDVLVAADLLKAPLTNAALVTPNLGTPSAGVMTNVTGTASGLTAGNVTTNANLTGHVTSTGNAAVLGSFTKSELSTAVSDGTPLYAGDVTSNATHTGDVTGGTVLTIAPGVVDVAMLANGTDGELITWDASGAAAVVAAGTATHVLTSNGAGAAPTFQAAAGGGGSSDGSQGAIQAADASSGFEDSGMSISGTTLTVTTTAMSKIVLGNQFGDDNFIQCVSSQIRLWGYQSDGLTVDTLGKKVSLTAGMDFINPSPNTVPSTAASTGTTGMMSWDSSFIYICTATNTWKRVAIATW